MSNTRVLLAHYVNAGPVTPDAFTVDQSQPLPTEQDLKDGEILVDNVYVSVDPYMRARFKDPKLTGGHYTSSYILEQPINGGAVGKVFASKAPGFAAGDYVVYGGEWKARNVVNAAVIGVFGPFKIHPAPGTHLSYYLGILGMPGRTAYVSLQALAPKNLKPGNTIFVSAAAGAVGAAVGQLAKHYGLKVIGSAGSAEKVKFLTGELKFDGAFNYKDFPSVVETVVELKRLAPEGIHIYYDNTGGVQLDAALVVANSGAEFIECGMISQYDQAGDGVRNLSNIVSKQLSINGFLIGPLASQHPDIAKKFNEEMPKLIREGKVSPLEEVQEGGWANVGLAFARLMTGDKIGKLVAKVGVDDVRGI